jgi:hypothetical protein
VPEPHDAADALAVAICHFHHACFANRILVSQKGGKIANGKMTVDKISISDLTRRRVSR